MGEISHVPAAQSLAGLELVAVASGSQPKADAAAKAFGAKAGYAYDKDLIRDTDVVIAVRVPDHRELVLAAVAARKHIYCEWPLGRDLAESEDIAAAAQAAGVHVAIGLQNASKSSGDTSA
jgi:predicted dehydrogenase